MARIDTRARDPNPEEGQHADLHDADYQNRETDVANAPPAQFKADAEEQQDESQFGQHADRVQVADEGCRQREWPDQHTCHQVAEYRRLLDHPCQGQASGGDHHRDGEVLQECGATL